MSWESVEEWPSQSASGVYRGAAEIIVAERSGLSAFERVVLWWHSTTDLPFADIAKDVVVTTHYVYVRKQDDTQMRVRRDLLAQGQVEGRRRQYSVPNAPDMVLSDRRGDDVERALMGQEEITGWTSQAAWKRTLLVIGALSWWAMTVSEEYLIEGAGAVGAGRYNSESAYWFYGCIAIWTGIVAICFFFPQRLIVDALGLRSVRGFLSGIRSMVPIEDIRYVEVRHQKVRTKNTTVHHYPVYVYTTHRFKRRVKLRNFKDGIARSQAINFGAFCAKTWNVEHKGLQPPKRND